MEKNVPMRGVGADKADRSVQDSIDKLSLSQTLQDFEIANARVVDLSQRLTTLSRELIETRTELTALKLHHAGCESRLRSAETLMTSRSSPAEAELRATLEQVKASRSVLLAKLFSRKLRLVLK